MEIVVGYYIRVLSPKEEPASPDQLVKAARALGGSASGDLDTTAWTQLVIANSKGDEIFVVERNATSDDDSLVAEEIGEFQDDIADCIPSSAVGWLRSYLESVRTIYAFQILSATDAENGWEILGAVKNAVVTAAGGIIQADGEGFTNEDGYHILWQFSDTVTGDWWMAVLKDGRWENFKMDLGNRAHRAAFMAGEVPAGAERA